MRKLIVGLTLGVSAVVAAAPGAGAATAPSTGNKGGQVCLWFPFINNPAFNKTGICLPL